MFVRGGAFGGNPGPFALPLITWRERARSLGWRVVEGLAAFATPAGDTTRVAYETLRDDILSELAAALPVDAVLLNLHGAMIADGYPDAEGDLIRRVREMVGPRVFVGVELDLHCHLTAQKIAAADAIVIYKEYPHVDVIERAEELFVLAQRSLNGGVRPVMAMHDCRMLGIFPTTREPLRGFVDRMAALEGKAGILSVSLAHGFPWGDTPEVGMRVLADTADNPGIGASGDSTFLIAHFLERNIKGIAVSPFWDPIVTDLAFQAGLGATLDIRLGGAEEILYVSAPGSGAMDMGALCYKNVSRVLWPRVADPHA